MSGSYTGRHIRRPYLAALLAAITLAGAACSSTDASPAATTGSGPGTSAEDSPATTASAPATVGVDRDERDFGPAPAAPTGDLSAEVIAALDVLFSEDLPVEAGEAEFEAVEVIAASGDPRLGWLLSDMLRVSQGTELGDRISRASDELLGAGLAESWSSLTDVLIGWDLPAPPEYLTYKRNLFTQLVEEWRPLFEDGSAVDWRHVSWGGVGIDDRAFGETDTPCDCIAAADDPEVTDAAGASWYADDRLVFGVVINGEARAYPRNIMEIREMVNDTLGGRDIAMPYCTLCGSAQVYFTDELPEGVQRPVLRTSGLLIRSNKMMFDVNTFSVFDTFLGAAVTGPLAAKGVLLEQASVITTTWGEWKEAYPGTTILDQRLALDRDSDLRNTRDADGPIFPIGKVDERLPVQEDVLGVVTKLGTPVAFPVKAAVAALQRGDEVRFDDVLLTLEAGGVKATDEEGNDVGAHQAFWFAWSQFHPDTELWAG